MTNNASSHILMVRPVRFGMNAQTAVDNFYQNQEAASGASDQEKALAEFEHFAASLTAHGVNVHVLEDTPEPHTPDSIFPNNWISMHSDGTVVLYPMKAENRRLERRDEIFQILKKWGFTTDALIDLTALEEEGVFLEGTGSIVFDHDQRIAYLARSQRADEQAFMSLCGQLKYTPVVFSAFQDTPAGLQPIYHTNVLMCMTNTYALICLDTIHDAAERAAVVKSIKDSDKDILEITKEQKIQFAGNMLLVKGALDQLFLVMSGSAYRALTPEQVARIELDHKIIYSDLPTIETLGGGSARCMLAEIYLAQKS
ncbi:MAG: arginine deiminase-related protein [Schleiferiaceae bacterium]|nr:arginine deiminase-related protein [Schleiferiaceae bacterium]